MPNKIDRSPDSKERIRRNFQRIAEILQVDEIGPVATAPASTVAPVAWLKLIVDGVEYRLPLYQ